MKRISGSALGLFLVGAQLTGCGGPPSQQAGAAGSIPQTQNVGSVMGSARSWMDPDAKTTRLLYVSSVLTNDVYAYSYSTHKLKGTLTGFQTPYGLCVDKAANVWIVNDAASQIVEYAHGGTAPIATLSDPGVYPEGCSVDPTTGNLAVTNFSSNSGSGSVSIYAGAQGSPKRYSDPTFANYRFCGYDAHGNLFVDGANGAAAFTFAELPKGSKTFKDISLKQNIEWPGGVQWDGKYITVGDTDTGMIYRVNARGQVKGSLQLSGANYVNQFWIALAPNQALRLAKVIVPSQDGGVVGYYKYPAGGPAITSIPVSEPFGATVSN